MPSIYLWYNICVKSENICICIYDVYVDKYEYINADADISMSLWERSGGSDTVGRVPSGSVAIICQHNTTHINKQTNAKTKTNKKHNSKRHTDTIKFRHKDKQIKC